MDLVKAEELAKNLIKEYVPEWSFAFNNKKRSLGVCSHSETTIYLSKFITAVNSEDQVTDTLLHEIAHAIVGPGYGHGSVWKATAAKLGCNPRATGKVDTSDEAKLKALGVKWAMICPQGSIIKTWYRKPRQSTFDKLSHQYITSRREETYGKLKIVQISEGRPVW